MRNWINKQLNKKWVYTLVIWLIVAGMVLAMMSPFVLWNYSQRYVQDSNTTATKGILFQKTIDLKVYTKLGEGNGFFGSYDRYSRSMTQGNGQVLSIYKD